MVNLRGALRGFGVGLSRVGELQHQEQAREAEDRRVRDRMAAMAALEQRIRNEDADTASKRELLQAGERDNQALDRLTRELPVREKHEISTEERAETRQVAREQRENQEWDRRQQREFDQWRQRHGIEEDTERARELWRREQGLDDAPAARYLRNSETGTYVAVDREGNQTDTGIEYPRTDTDDDLGLGDEESGASPLSTAVEETVRTAREAGSARPQGGDRREPLRTRQGAPVRVRTVEEARRLPPGTRFITPDGQIRVRQ